MSKDNFIEKIEDSLSTLISNARAESLSESGWMEWEYSADELIDKFQDNLAKIFKTTHSIKLTKETGHGR